jgi:hypothetical protein
MKGIMTMERLTARIAETNLKSFSGLADKGQSCHTGQLAYRLVGGPKS